MAAGTWDVIIVGARVAGAATAMLLARRGLRVLVVNRSRFPSDTLSSHQVQPPGVALLRRWGLLDHLEAAGTPATTVIRYDASNVVLEGGLPAHEGVDAIYSPRRTLLDSVLVTAARATGAEVREGYLVESLAWADGRIVSVSGRERGGTRSTETARLVIGADGKHSTVANAVNAHRYRSVPTATMACYTYWSGLDPTRGELYQRPNRVVAAFPTNDALTMVYVAAPLGEFEVFRTDLQRHYLATLDLCGDLGERVRAGQRAERFRASPDLPNGFRVPFGPGWALVGDAGVVMDPISAQGIGNALRDAERLSAAVTAGFDGAKSLETALTGHWRQRDAALGPMYGFTMRLAEFRSPGRAERQLLASLRGRPSEIERFFGVFAGVTPISQFRSPLNLLRLLGVGGLARIATGRISAPVAGEPAVTETAMAETAMADLAATDPGSDATGDRSATGTGR